MFGDDIACVAGLSNFAHIVACIDSVSMSAISAKPISFVSPLRPRQQRRVRRRWMSPWPLVVFIGLTE